MRRRRRRSELWASRYGGEFTRLETETVAGEPGRTIVGFAEDNDVDRIIIEATAATE